MIITAGDKGPALFPDETRKSMLILRAAGVPDALIGEAFGISRQRVHANLGPRDPGIVPLVPQHAKQPPELAPLPLDPVKALPAALYAWRARRNLTQGEAAPLLGVSAIAWSTWERGSRKCALAAVVLRQLELLDKLEKMSGCGK